MTIAPGVIIKPGDSKVEDDTILVEGTLIIGKKDATQVIIEIPSTIKFSGAQVEMNHVIFTSATIKLTGDTERLFSHCVFIHNMKKKINPPFEMSIPKRGVLSFSFCNFVNHPISLPDNIQDAKDKIKFEKCAFTPRWDEKNARYTSVSIDSDIFLIGTKCDLYTYVQWKKMTYDFNPPVSTQWYIKDMAMKNSLNSLLKNTKGFKVDFYPHFTNFKPELPPEEKNALLKKDR